MIRAMLSLVLVAGLPAAQPKNAVQPDSSSTRFVMTGNYFECDMPQGWTSKSDTKADLTGVFSVEFMPPDFSPLEPVSVVASYYSEGNKAIRDSQSFIRNMTSNPLKLSGKTVGSISEMPVNSRKAIVIDRSRVIFVPPNDPAPKKIQLKEKFTVIDGTKGFYVIEYQASGDVYDRYFDIYNATVNSFKPFL